MKHIADVESVITSKGPVDAAIIVSTDTKKFYVDIENTRYEISDIIEVETEDELNGLLAPINNKFYFVIETNKLYRRAGSEWKEIGGGTSSGDTGGGTSVTISNETNVSEVGTAALDAVQNNPDIENTLANKISKAVTDDNLEAKVNAMSGLEAAKVHNAIAGDTDANSTGALVLSDLYNNTGIFNGNGNGTGASGIANLFIKSFYGVGFVDGSTGGVTINMDLREGDMIVKNRITADKLVIGSAIRNKGVIYFGESGTSLFVNGNGMAHFSTLDLSGTAYFGSARTYYISNVGNCNFNNIIANGNVTINESITLTDAQTQILFGGGPSYSIDSDGNASFCLLFAGTFTSNGESNFRGTCRWGTTQATTYATMSNTGNLTCRAISATTGTFSSYVSASAYINAGTTITAGGNITSNGSLISSKSAYFLAGAYFGGTTAVTTDYYLGTNGSIKGYNITAANNYYIMNGSTSQRIIEWNGEGILIGNGLPVKFGTASQYMTTAGNMYMNGFIVTENAYYVQNSSGSNIQALMRATNSSTDYIAVGNSNYGTILRGSTCTLKTSSGTAVTSDERVKENFNSLDKYEDFFMDIEPVEFTYKKDAKKTINIGVKAHQVQDTLKKYDLPVDESGIVIQTYDNPEDDDYCGVEDPLCVIYTQFDGLEIHMIQKAFKELKEANDRIATLESTVKILMSEVKGLKGIE